MDYNNEINDTLFVVMEEFGTYYISKSNPIKESLVVFDKREREAILRNNKNVIVNNKDELKRYVLEALNNKNMNKNLYLGIIPNKVIQRIKEEVTDIKQEKSNTFLIESKNYDLAINQEEIRHIYKKV